MTLHRKAESVAIALIYESMVGLQEVTIRMYSMITGIFKYYWMNVINSSVDHVKASTTFICITRY